MPLAVGDKVKFAHYVQRWNVVAANARFAICTKPLNAIGHCLYTIVDWERKVRGMNNLIFNDYDYASKEELSRCLNDLDLGITDVSRRNYVDLDLEAIYRVEGENKP